MDNEAIFGMLNYTCYITHIFVRQIPLRIRIRHFPFKGKFQPLHNNTDPHIGVALGAWNCAVCNVTEI